MTPLVIIADAVDASAMGSRFLRLASEDVRVLHIDWSYGAGEAALLSADFAILAVRQNGPSALTLDDEGIADVTVSRCRVHSDTASVGDIYTLIASVTTNEQPARTRICRARILIER